MVENESSAEKKRWGKSFRQSFSSFRTGPGPNQTAANQKYIDEQLERFVDSCKTSRWSGEGYFTPQEVREHINEDKWAHLGARKKTTPPTPSPHNRREAQFAQQKNLLRNHARCLFKEYSDTEEERRELLRQASTFLHEADPSLTPSNHKRTSFHSQYWHSRIHDIPEHELIFELQHHLEANGRIRLSDEHTRVSLLSLLALSPSLDTPAKLFEFLNLRTGYTLVIPCSYDSSDSAPSIDAPTPPLRTDTVQSTKVRLIDVPTPDFTKLAPNLPDPTEFSPMTTSDPDPIEETPGNPTPRQETDQFTPPTSTSLPIASPTMSHHHTLHPTPVSAPPPMPHVDENTVKQESVIYTSAPCVWGGCKQTVSSTAGQRSDRFDDWAAHLEATLDLGNLEETRKLRLMHSKLYEEAAEEFDNFKLDNPILAQEFSVPKE
ncbi:hypothetical protein OUZ56_023743 [Daphnia magna]|uniref:Uncharacterized protein n=1 Tax=Daphnia magna TaxID=35525 RepID=A0ABR0AZD0_9CRUS|nr:hypothetical protein OUZ56_023743 [Daphnia magna]